MNIYSQLYYHDWMTGQIKRNKVIKNVTTQHPYWKLWIEKTRNMKAASIVNEAYFVEQWKRLRKQLKPIALFW